MGNRYPLVLIKLLIKSQRKPWSDIPSIGQDVNVYRFLRTRMPTIQSFSEGAEDYMEPFANVVSNYMYFIS